MPGISSLPFDVANQIVREHLDQQGSAYDLYALSRSFLLACRLENFKSISVSILDVERLKNLLAIFLASPDAASAVRTVVITDQCRQLSPWTEISNRDDRYFEATSENSTLSSILRLCKTNFMLESSLLVACANHSCHALKWHNLSTSIQELFRGTYLKEIRLGGIREIPQSLSVSLLSVKKITISQCTFIDPRRKFTDVSIVQAPASSSLESFTFTWTPLDVQITPSIEVFSILEHWKLAAGFNLPTINRLVLGISNWESITNASQMIEAFGHNVDMLLIDTSCLGLSSLTIPQFLSDDFLRTQTSEPHQRRSLRLREGWAARSLHPLSLSLMNLKLNHKINRRWLRFGISYWDRRDSNHYNGEMEWLSTLLCDLPSQVTQSVEVLTIYIYPPSLLSGDPTLSLIHSIETLEEHYTWSIFNEAFRNGHWSRLERVHIDIQINISLAIFDSRVIGGFCRYAKERIQNSCLHSLHEIQCPLKITFTFY